MREVGLEARPGRQAGERGTCWSAGLMRAAGARDQRVTGCARESQSPSLTRRRLFSFLRSLRPQMCSAHQKRETYKLKLNQGLLF